MCLSATFKYGWVEEGREATEIVAQFCGYGSVYVFIAKRQVTETVIYTENNRLIVNIHIITTKKMRKENVENIVYFKEQRRSLSVAYLSLFKTHHSYSTLLVNLLHLIGYLY